MQRAEERGQAAVNDCRTKLDPVQREMETQLKKMLSQVGEDQTTLQQHRDELSVLSTGTLETVNNFLSNELQKDLPTGKTLHQRNTKQ